MLSDKNCCILKWNKQIIWHIGHTKHSKLIYHTIEICISFILFIVTVSFNHIFVFPFCGHPVKSSLEPLAELFVNHQFYLKNDRSIVFISSHGHALSSLSTSLKIYHSIYFCWCKVYLIVYLHIIWLTFTGFDFNNGRVLKVLFFFFFYRLVLLWAFLMLTLSFFSSTPQPLSSSLLEYYLTIYIHITLFNRPLLTVQSYTVFEFYIYFRNILFN